MQSCPPVAHCKLCPSIEGEAQLDAEKDTYINQVSVTIVSLSLAIPAWEGLTVGARPPGRTN